MCLFIVLHIHLSCLLIALYWVVVLLFQFQYPDISAQLLLGKTNNKKQINEICTKTQQQHHVFCLSFIITQWSTPPHCHQPPPHVIVVVIVIVDDQSVLRHPAQSIPSLFSSTHDGDDHSPKPTTTTTTTTITISTFDHTEVTTTTAAAAPGTILHQQFEPRLRRQWSHLQGAPHYENIVGEWRSREIDVICGKVCCSRFIIHTTSDGYSFELHKCASC